MTERELLGLAAKAAGMEGWEWDEEMQCMGRWKQDEILGPVWQGWNPLTDDGDALRLAVRLNLDIRYESYDAGVAVIVGGAWDGAPEAIHEIFERDGPRAVRRAIVRAAAEIQLQRERNGQRF